MSQLLVLIDGNETMILESKLQYFQEVLGAEIIEVKEKKSKSKKDKK